MQGPQGLSPFSTHEMSAALTCDLPDERSAATVLFRRATDAQPLRPSASTLSQLDGDAASLLHNSGKLSDLTNAAKLY